MLLCCFCKKKNYKCQKKFGVLRDEICIFEFFLPILLLVHFGQDIIRVYDCIFLLVGMPNESYLFVYYYCYIHPVVQLEHI